MTLSECHLPADEVAIALGGEVRSAALGNEPVPLATKDDLRRLLVRLGTRTYEGWEQSAQLWLADDRTGTGMHLIGPGYPDDVRGLGRHKEGMARWQAEHEAILDGLLCSAAKGSR